MEISTLRGHEIYRKNREWFYFDTNEPTAGNHRPCGHCGKPDTPEGHDGCLGTLDKSLVMNACCGHGNQDEAYIQFWDGSELRGKEAIESFKKLKS